ncbi:unnamed protein product [Ixodes pacificus]
MCSSEGHSGPWAPVRHSKLYLLLCQYLQVGNQCGDPLPGRDEHDQGEDCPSDPQCSASVHGPRKALLHVLWGQGQDLPDALPHLAECTHGAGEGMEKP